MLSIRRLSLKMEKRKRTTKHNYN